MLNLSRKGFFNYTHDNYTLTTTYIYVNIVVKANKGADIAIKHPYCRGILLILIY